MKIEQFVQIDKVDPVNYKQLGKSVYEFLKVESDKIADGIETKKEKIKELKERSDERLMSIAQELKKNQTILQNFANTKKKILSEY